MDLNFTIFSGFFLAASLVSFFVAFLGTQKYHVKGASNLVWLMIAAGIWVLFTVVETTVTTMETKILWAKFGYLGAISTPVLYLIFVLRFTGFEKYLKNRNILLLFIIPFITLLIAFTNEKHGLLWSGFSAIPAQTNIMEYYHGLWFWVGYMAYNYILLALATIALFHFIIKQNKSFSWQGWVVLLAGICPWTASVFYLLRVNIVPGLDLVPVSIILSGALFGYAILYTRFLDLVPIARETLVETMTDGIIVLDVQNRIQDINQSARRYLGFSGRNIIGTNLNDSNHIPGELLNALRSLVPVEMVEGVVDNQPGYFRITNQPIRTQSGSRLVVIRDISDQVTHQMEIEAAEERFREMVTLFRLMSDNLSDMLWAKDLNKKYVFANRSVCENLLQAVDTDEPIGKDDLFFASRERQKYPDRPDWHTFGELCQDSDSDVIKAAQPGRFDEFGNVKGAFLYLDVRKAPIFDKTGQMIGVVGSARDVTIQKKAEEEIYKRDRLLDAIAEATALLVQGNDLDLGINRALEIIGKAAEVNRVYIFQNTHSADFAVPMMSQRYEWSDDTVDAQINNPELQNLPYEIACPRWFDVLSMGKTIAGNIREFPEIERIALSAQGIMSILVTPVFIDNVFWGFVGFDDCMGERVWPQNEEQILSAAANTIGAAYLRKKTQVELIAAKEKAEESDRLKSAFLANMSHEIRTPMNGILGFAELLKEPELTGDEHDKYIGIIEKSGVRMLNIINDLVDLSKLESGQMEVSLTKVDVNRQLEYIHSFFKPEAEGKGLKFSYAHCLDFNECLIKTDKEKVYAILTNLIKNAIKFTHSGAIELGCRKTDGFLEYFVKDTGIGIPKQKQLEIFSRFVQANSLTRDPLQGAGLGLSIAKAYVELLGGMIWVDSVPDEGSVFYFTIPRS
jgi:PAS domain S-box-containing protein